jgi:hypothetical protein
MTRPGPLHQGGTAGEGVDRCADPEAGPWLLPRDGSPSLLTRGDGVRLVSWDVVGVDHPHSR